MSQQLRQAAEDYLRVRRAFGYQLRDAGQRLPQLIEAAKGNRYGHRDATMILLTYRHGLRAVEVCDLRWDQVDFNGAVLHVRRVKNGTPSTHPIQGDELRSLRRLQRESPTSPFVFVSERGSPFTTAGFARMIEREEYCVDILQQTAALRAAVDSLSIMVLEDHVTGCVRTAAEQGKADEYVDESSTSCGGRSVGRSGEPRARADGGRASRS